MPRALDSRSTGREASLVCSRLLSSHHRSVNLNSSSSNRTAALPQLRQAQPVHSAVRALLLDRNSVAETTAPCLARLDSLAAPVQPRRAVPQRREEHSVARTVEQAPCRARQRGRQARNGLTCPVTCRAVRPLRCVALPSLDHSVYARQSQSNALLYPSACRLVAASKQRRPIMGLAGTQGVHVGLASDSLRRG